MKEKSILYIIQGFIGSGKTTFSKKLANETGAIRLNPDELVCNMFSYDEYMTNWDNCFNYVMDIIWDKTKVYLHENNSVILDMGFWLREDRDFARLVARECHADFVHYFLNVPDEILKQRIIKDRPLGWVRKHLNDFESNKVKFVLPEKDEQAIIINNF